MECPPGHIQFKPSLDLLRHLSLKRSKEIGNMKVTQQIGLFVLFLSILGRESTATTIPARNDQEVFALRDYYGRIKEANHLNLVDENRNEISFSDLMTMAQKKGVIDFVSLDQSEYALRIVASLEPESQNLKLTLAYYPAADTEFQKSVAGSEIVISSKENLEKIEEKLSEALMAMDDMAKFGDFSFLRSITDFLFPPTYGSVHPNTKKLIVLGFAMTMSSVIFCYPPFRERIACLIFAAVGLGVLIGGSGLALKEGNLR